MKYHKTLKHLATVEKNKKTVHENICGGIRNNHKNIINACMIVWEKPSLMAPLKGRDISKLSPREIAVGQM